MINVESAIESRQFVSTWSGVTYTGWYKEDGRMVGCNCRYAEFYPGQCKHCHQHNAALEAILTTDLEAHVSDDLNSCFHCGYLTKGFICHRCS